MSVILRRFNMDKRTAIIVAALAAPVLSLAILAKFSAASHRDSSAKPTALSTVSQPRQLSKTEMIMKVRLRLAQIEKMTPAEWAEFKNNHPGAADTQAEAIANNKKRLAELTAGDTAQQQQNQTADWAIQQIQTAPPRPAAAAAAARLPELNPTPAKPASPSTAQ
jgi:hypothetical protein